MMPTDPRIFNASKDELVFMEYYLDKDKSKEYDVLGKMLGTLWTPDDVKDSGEGEAFTGNKLLVPLALSIRPELLKFAKKILGHSTDNIPTDLRGSDVVELGDLPREEMSKLFDFADNLIKE